MRFPGRRKHKHYFPVHERDPLLHHAGLDVPEAKVHVVGIDQTLVDVDARVPDELLGRYELTKGSSMLIDDERAVALYDELFKGGRISAEFAG